MRPIEKKRPGELIQYKDSRGNIVNHVVQKSYSCYGDAKLPLVGNLDRYCSYCEGPREIDSLEVEHRVARNNGGSETDWDNFLLCCKVCNTIKSTADVGECHWPHLDNTFLDFIYQEDGRVKLNPELSGLSRIKAQNLYNLVKLGRSDNGATPKDFRWQRRYETWNKAKKVLAKYDDGKLDENDMIGFAKSTGYWSIWFIVFENKEEIRSRLISDFSGTCRSCFDANNHYSPVPRNL